MTSAGDRNPSIQVPGRHAAFRIWLVLLAALAVPVGITHVVIRCISVANFNIFAEGRVRDFLKALPAIPATEKKTALVFGSSLVLRGFRPIELDKLLHDGGYDVTSFNLGLPGLNVHYWRLLAENVERAYAHAHRRAGLTVLEFCPFQATEASVQKLIPPSDQLLAALEDGPTLVNDVWSRPDRGLSRLVYRYLFDGVNPNNLQYVYYGHWAYATPSWWFGEMPTPQAYDALVPALNRRAYEDRWQAYRWSQVTRGADDLLRDDTRDVYDAFVRANTTPTRLAEDVDGFVKSDDILELHFSAQLVAEFVEMCRISSRMGDRTILLLAPQRPSLESSRSAAARERRHLAIEEIERGCGSSFIDLSSPGAGFTDSDFADVVHVSQDIGRTKFEHALAEKILTHSSAQR